MIVFRMKSLSCVINWTIGRLKVPVVVVWQLFATAGNDQNRIQNRTRGPPEPYKGTPKPLRRGPPNTSRGCQTINFAPFSHVFLGHLRQT